MAPCSRLQLVRVGCKGNLYIEAKATFGPLMDITCNIWEI
jgi:hypothetical protein